MAEKRAVELYVTYHKENQLHPKLRPELFARVALKDLKFLVKKAGLYIHRPDFGTGVVVINQSNQRWYPTLAQRKAIRAEERKAFRKIKQECGAKVK